MDDIHRAHAFEQRYRILKILCHGLCCTWTETENENNYIKVHAL
jgi:hypothetical protein